MEDNASLIAALQARMPPFSKFLDIKFLSASPERLTAEMFVREELCTTPAILHGGALMAFADTLGAYVTVVNLRRGLRDDHHRIENKFLCAGACRRQSYRGVHCSTSRQADMAWQTRITNEAGRLIAVVTQTQMVLEPRTSA